MTWKKRLFSVTALAAAVCLSSVTMAVDGTWIQTSDGQWESGTSWASGTIAQGADATANFNTLDIVDQGAPFYRVGVGVSTNQTIGHMIFGDTNTATPGAWEIYVNTGTPVITLEGTSPSITVHPMGPIDTGVPPIIDDAVIRADVAGTSGLTKLGTGVLTLDGTTNTLTGPIAVNAGTFRVIPKATPMAAPNVTIADGANLEFPYTVNSIAVAAGGTGTYTFNGTGNTSAGNVNAPGTGESLNLNLTTGSVLSIGGAWTGFQNVNITGTTAGTTGVIRMAPNNSFGGAPPAFDTNSFATSKVNLDNVRIFVRTNSQGNTVAIAELTGTQTGILAGGNSGTAARYSIGSNNNSSTFFGTIDGAGGLSLEKLGTGTLTLAGTFTNSPAINNTPARQGGVFRAANGTLKITGASSIPGGPAANPTILTTIDVLPGATFDVSEAPTTFTTSIQQKVQGGGTIVGNWNHAAGRINPGDVGAPTAANEGNLSSGVTPTAGTITFNGNLELSGGSIVYDMSPTPGSGNDLVHVTGTTTLTSGRVTPNFLAGIPTTGTYTVITSDGGFSGSVAGVSVDMPGRTPDQPVMISGGTNLVFEAADIVDGKALIWTGSTNGAWDLETTQNWTDGSINERFFNFDSVAFTEAGANKTITLNAVAQPVGTITIDNTTDYSFSGTGSIVGEAGLTKTGGGALNMSLNNTFTGPVSISDSAVNVANFSGLGTGPLTLSNASYTATVSVSNSSLDVPAGTTSTIQLDGAGATGGTANIPSLTGGGTLNLTSTTADKYFGTFDTSGFTGTLNVAPSGAAGVLGQIRIRGGQTDFSNAVVNLTATSVSNQQGAAADTSVTVGFGEIHADAQSNLVAFNGGSVPPDVVWQIGARNTDSDIAGVISDGAGANGDASIANVEKIGTGTLTLTGVNTYTGDTMVNGGTLSINNAFLADAADVFIDAGATFDLNFSDNDTIDSLYLDGVPQAPGLYGLGALGSSFFSGAGRLMVTTLGAPLGVTGDYNGNGVVDAADYTVWRDNLGGDASALENRDPNNMGLVSQDDYNSWKANFGMVAGAGAGAGASSTAAVPEPASWLLACAIVLLPVATRRRVR